jgi:transposase-like protein
MATLTVTRQDTTLQVNSQGFSLPIHDTWWNRKVLFIVLRALRSRETGKPLFTYQQLAEVFGYQHRQNIQNFWQEWEQSGGDFLTYLQRKRKVDAEVVEAVASVVRKRPLATAGQLCLEVAAQVGRSDLTPANIRTALEEVSCQVIRPILQQQWEAGTFHPKEQVILQEALAALLASPTSAQSPVVEELQESGIEPVMAQASRPVQRQQDASVSVLLNPTAPVAHVSAKIRLMVVALTLYFWNVPLSRIGLWFGVSKSTVLNWVTGLAVALYPTIQRWIVSGVTAASVALDEKWLKIRQAWHYWFVGVDEATGLPVVMALLPTRTTWACCWVLVSLKRLGLVPKVIITDGLASYLASIPAVFATTKHLLCVFHHQQGVTRWIREHAASLPAEVVPSVKRLMKQVVQTCDPRTVTRRLTRLASHDVAQHGDIAIWVQRTTARLTHLLPALRRNAYPRTTNSVERFFRAFQRFYKTRAGFHSVGSAIRETLVFVVVYVFTVQVSTGTAPIEQVLPEACHMPFYKILNDPFRYGLANMCQANPGGVLFLATQHDSLESRQA